MSACRSGAPRLAKEEAHVREQNSVQAVVEKAAEYCDTRDHPFFFECDGVILPAVMLPVEVWICVGSGLSAR